MRKLILRMELTLDEMGAGENGPLDMIDLGDEGSWADIFAMMETVDAMMLGGNTYREYLDYWHNALNDPKTKPNERKFAEVAVRTPHFVLSRKPLDLAKWPNASVLAGGIDGIPKLKEQPGRDIVLWGGPTIASAVSEAGHIDEYHLVTHPVIAGRGKRLFGNAGGVRRVRHLDTKTLPSGIVIDTYARA